MRWGQRGNPSSHWTIGLSHQWFYLGLVGLTLLHCFFALILPPIPSELVAWAYSQNLLTDDSFVSPLLALVIRCSTAIFGHTLFGLRLPAILLSTLSILALSTITARHYILGLALITPIFFIGAVVMSAESLLVFFWSLYVVWLIGANRILNEWHGDPVTRVYRRSPVPKFSWVIGGILLALGTVSHPIMALALPCTLAVLVPKYRLKGWIQGFAILLTTATTLAALFIFFKGQPLWLIHQPFWSALTLAKQNTSAIGSFLFSEWLLVGALPFVLFPIALIKAPDLCHEPRMQVSFAFFVLPLLCFLGLSWRHQVQGHWALVAYLSFLPLAQWMIDYTSFRGLVRWTVILSFLVPFAVSLLFWVHFRFPLKAISPDSDKLSHWKAQYQLAKKMKQTWEEKTPHVPLVTTDKEWHAYFNFLGVKANWISEQALTLASGTQNTISSPAGSQAFSLCETPELLLWHESKTVPQATSCFSQAEFWGEFPLTVRDQEWSRLSLVKYRK